jgi:LysM repeat protein
VSINAVTDAAPKPAQVTVHSGETLWDVATRIAPKHDPREIVAQLQRLNHLSSPRLVAGQVLLVPRG